ncbi:MAG: MoxR family ATPase [Bacteroidetes bacterium]|nr:MAG: MoxR family ATPase [Bacteroidota bacterium]
MPIKLHTQVRRSFSPDAYIMHEALSRAVEAALLLGQPLLLTGEPGTGKTLLAYKVAHELSKDPEKNYLPEPLVFNTKTTSAARDLFYTYDALSHFQAANVRRENGQAAPRTADFIELQALGKAIAMTNPQQVDRSKFNTELPDEPHSCVVLIDEIDKAPRDFTNDILNEIENYRFAIKEMDNYEIKRGEDHQIVVIMTSNSEKNLPDAFLRRCVFYHIPFPDDELLREIVHKQLGGSTYYTEEALKHLIGLFGKIRSKAVRKPPATAELIAWLRILEMQDFLSQDEDSQNRLLLQNLSILVKTKEDLDAVRQAFLKL